MAEIKVPFCCCTSRCSCHRLSFTFEHLFLFRTAMCQTSLSQLYFPHCRWDVRNLVADTDETINHSLVLKKWSIRKVLEQDTRTPACHRRSRLGSATIRAITLLDLLRTTASPRSGFTFCDEWPPIELVEIFVEQAGVHQAPPLATAGSPETDTSQQPAPAPLVNAEATSQA